jgi:restriction endonuclease
MLRNVLEDYLNSINERDFDYPLSSLLQGMGFHDIHFTHGAVEFGKDFIAKRVEDGTEYQYAIQSKKGDIGQGLWRNEIRGQLEEAISSDLSHPQFNTSLPRKVILVTTGRLSGNARLASQEFKTKLAREDQVQDL